MNNMKKIKDIAQEIHTLQVNYSKLAWVQYTAGYYETELCIPAMLFAKENQFTIASDQDIVKCMDGRRLMIDKQVKDVKAEDIDVLIIPGGNPIPREDIFQLIRDCEARGRLCKTIYR